MTPDARVLRFPPSVTVRPQDYGQFSRGLSADELPGCFCFSDDDRRQIARRRGDVNRLGFAVQLGTVRYLGRVTAGSAREFGLCQAETFGATVAGAWCC